MNYTTIIGLEIHAELLTDSKIFCSCKNAFGGKPNERVCPVCSGMPGTLPRINKNAVMLAVKAGFALDCTINNYSAFDRKNYFYPDLPKAYQITQARYPICSDGHIDINNNRIRINRIHIEEDAGKLIHDVKTGESYADFNRCGVPLIEIVTEPDFNSADDVADFISEVALRLKYQNICDARMEQGSLRVDINISIKPDNSDTLGTRTEIKNLNSLKAIKKAIEYESKRQAEILRKGGTVVRETRRFDDNSCETYSLRSKENASDYRYFPEPDIPPIYITESEIKKIKSTMYETPNSRRNRYITDFSLPFQDAILIVQNRSFSDFYDNAVKEYKNYRLIANLMLVELNRCLNEANSGPENIPFSPKNLATVAKLCDDGKITKNSAKQIISIMYSSGKNPIEIAESEGLLLSADSSELESTVRQIIAENPTLIVEYRNGNEKILAYLMGQVSRKGGKGINMSLARKLLLNHLNCAQ